MRYNVIIVGSGSSGATLAARLSEDPSCSILLLEAGLDYDDNTKLPPDVINGRDVMAASQGSSLWDFMATGNEHQEQPMPVPRGKIIGGSSSVNGTIFIRGLPEDYDGWAAQGNVEWSFVKLLPYLRKLEHDLDFGGDFHGKKGPIPVFRFKREEWRPSLEAFYEACRSEGFPHEDDMNSPDTSGVGARPLNNVDGVRISTAIGYLNPSRHRINLTIKSGVLVTRVIFQGRRAVGVEVVSGGVTFVVEGDQVVLSAGAIGSPFILLHSGVGPSEQLNSLGIPIVSDLPGVGENLRDHPSVLVYYRIRKGFEEESGPSQVGLRWTATGSSTRNDMFISPYPGEVIEGKIHTGFRVILELASSAGRLSLTSPRPDVNPLLEYRYLSDPWDLSRMRDGVRLCIKLASNSLFTNLFECRTSPSDKEIASDDALDTWILENASTAHHSSGTCKMGPASDPTAVVDQYCSVHGVQGLRVVDASIMPEIIRANTNLTSVMIGERVVDWVRSGSTQGT